MNEATDMYDWRHMTPEERALTLAQRKKHNLPWHSPLHTAYGEGQFLISAACYEHARFIGHSGERMRTFETLVLSILEEQDATVSAWAILPNHYHLLAQVHDIKKMLNSLGRFHGRTSRRWNLEEQARGRQVFCRCTERRMRSERHFYATVNYIHHNPVKHGWVKRWQDWPFGSAARFLEDVGKEEAARIWRKYPVEGYGNAWDK